MQRRFNEAQSPEREGCARWDRIRAGLRALVPSPPRFPSLNGRMLSRYRIRKVLGAGSMGTVYLAQDTQLDRLVAIKVSPADRHRDGPIKWRFLQAARCAAAIEHPHIAAIHDLGHAEDLDFIVMEYVSGRTLDRVLPRDGLTPVLSFRYARQLASALARIHSAGMIHRDLKPGNIMIAENHVKLLDFGLAKPIRPTLRYSNSYKSEFLHTRDGTILGTAGYLAPEQVRGKAADARSDIFSFGAVFYEMLTGRRLFKERSEIETMTAILRPAVPSLPARIPAPIGAIVLRCLQRNPGRRYRMGSHLVSALDRAARRLGYPSAP